MIIYNITLICNKKYSKEAAVVETNGYRNLSNILNMLLSLISIISVKIFSFKNGRHGLIENKIKVKYIRTFINTFLIIFFLLLLLFKNKHYIYFEFGSSNVQLKFLLTHRPVNSY